eukprot:TRINITY_DN24028_c0_g1_i1.p1 TRINITY_DN24028_c0_g1~~TRINITY_DN24028_c0_g1_i1.p1  ORF type:complete len:756 (+),score=152.13 TRINITY_DN24028_c0_g1_i1:172-2439(+)
MQGHSPKTQPMAEVKSVVRTRLHSPTRAHNTTLSTARAHSATRVHRVHATLAKNVLGIGDPSPRCAPPNRLLSQSGEQTQDISNQGDEAITIPTNEEAFLQDSEQSMSPNSRSLGAANPESATLPTLSVLARAVATEIDVSLTSLHDELKQSVEGAMSEHDASLKLWWHTRLKQSVQEAAKQSVQECLKQFMSELATTIAAAGLRLDRADGPDAGAGPGKVVAPPPDATPKPPDDEAETLPLEKFGSIKSLPGTIMAEEAEQTLGENNPAHGRRNAFRNYKSEGSDDEEVSSKPGGEKRSRVLRGIVKSRVFEATTGVCIVLNCLFIGWQTQYLAKRADEDVAANRELQTKEPWEFTALQIGFSSVFFVELVMRMAAEGLYKFLMSSEWSWNLTDIMVVFLDMVNMILELAAMADTANFTVVRALRVIRVVRLVKVIRIMRFFRELRMMIYSILGSLKSLLWVIVVQSLMFSIFGVCFVTGVTTEMDSVETRMNPENKDVLELFGSLDRAILALYMSMTGGNDWDLYYSALTRSLPWYYSMLYLLFITFALFAVVNIVTGVFVENAMQNSIKDRDFLVREELEQKKEYLKNMQALFEEMDKLDSGTILVDGFEDCLADEQVTAYFRALKLDVSDARNLFKLLDFDGSGEIDYNEFVEGCWKLQGEARGLDTKLIGYEVRFLRDQIAQLSSSLRAVLQAQGVNPDVLSENAEKPRTSTARRSTSVFSKEGSLKEDYPPGRASFKKPSVLIADDRAG